MFESVVKTLSDDKHVLGEILIHDIAVDADPTLKIEPKKKSNWTALKGFGGAARNEPINKGVAVLVDLHNTSE